MEKDSGLTVESTQTHSPPSVLNYGDMVTTHSKTYIRRTVYNPHDYTYKTCVVAVSPSCVKAAVMIMVTIDGWLRDRLCLV